MKTKTFLVGLFFLVSAVLFGMQIWEGLVALFPTLTESQWVHFKIPVINAEIVDVIKSLFISILAIVGSKITRLAIFK